ncbi:hypothetical protein GDO81_025878 [Engystomops pustulosus]|uniref:Uncharacterized protein n=1 Tax=Engystomops pustulosus TaxID=76066 RepID=A0AAV6YKS4_ENGPU|nr:hypothetical protein GDO81_025878 [Engystomops pustulosus]
MSPAYKQIISSIPQQPPPCILDSSLIIMTTGSMYKAKNMEMERTTLMCPFLERGHKSKKVSPQSNSRHGTIIHGLHIANNLIFHTKRSPHSPK